MHVACPHCGTAYTLSDAMVARPRLRLRCRRCREVWEPRAPDDAEPAPVVEAEAPPPPHQPAAPAPSTAARPRWRLAAVLYVAASLALVGGASVLGWVYRDGLPPTAAPLPQLSEVEPVWRSDEQGRRLLVSAAVDNPSGEPTEVRRVRVKFLSAQGAWIAETVVDVTPVTVPPGGSAPLEMAVDRLPEGTASLELSVLPPPLS